MLYARKCMRNWSCDLKGLGKRSKKALRQFILEQKINYGLGGNRLSKKQLLALWNELNIDPLRKRFLAFLLWPKKF